MHCFFNLVDAQGFILDVEGVEVSEVEGLRTRVIGVIDEIRRADTSAARDWTGWRLEVSDHSGTVILSIKLDSFASESLLHLPLGKL
jgi:hypothetical protein